MLIGYISPLVVIIFIALVLAVRSFSKRHNAKRDIVIIAAIIILAAVLEIGMGRATVYEHGSVKIWSGNINSDQNSQQIADPYSFTHIIHGLGFYALANLIPGASIGARAILAIGGESAWEVLENTDMVVNKYRAETISLNYYGDSVINSVFDILFALFGFLIAWRFPVRYTIILFVAIELVLLFWIRDNLTINILMLIYPIKAIKTWQMGV